MSREDNTGERNSLRNWMGKFHITLTVFVWGLVLYGFDGVIVICEDRYFAGLSVCYEDSTRSYQMWSYIETGDLVAEVHKLKMALLRIMDFFFGQGVPTAPWTISGGQPMKTKPSYRMWSYIVNRWPWCGGSYSCGGLVVGGSTKIST